MGTPIPTPLFRMSLERADGTTETVPISFDFDALDQEDRQRAITLWDNRDSDHLAAALIFVGTGLADEDFVTVAPTLVHAVQGQGNFEFSDGAVREVTA